MRARLLFGLVLALAAGTIASHSRAQAPGEPVPPPHTWVEVDLETEFDEGFSQIFSKGKNDSWVVWARIDFKNKVEGNRMRCWVKDLGTDRWHKMEGTEADPYSYYLKADSGGERSFFFTVPYLTVWGEEIFQRYEPTLVYAEIYNDTEVVAWCAGELYWWGTFP
jgi:hypothetical protein